MNEKLDHLGIYLILLPVPPRAAIYPDKLSEKFRAPAPGEPRLDEGLQDFYSSLREAGVDVLDLTESFLGARFKDERLGPVCCERDSHWSPRGIRLAAAEVASHIEKTGLLSQVSSGDIIRSDSTEIEYIGDLGKMLSDPGLASLTSRDSIAKVTTPSGETIMPDLQSPVMLMSDNHGLVFSAGGDMHFSGGGFPDQLACELGTRLDLISRRGSGASIRRDLARRFLQNPESPKAKKILIYCLAAHSLASSPDWKPVPLYR